MTPFRLERTATTPEIVLLPQERVLVLRGECYPENPIPLFGQVLASLDRCLAREGFTSLEVTIQLGYVNSASTKGLRKLFGRLDRAAEAGVAVQLIWEHEVSDDTMEELGRDLAEDLHFLELETRAYRVRAA